MLDLPRTLQWIVGLPDDPLWKWVFILFGLALLGWGVIRTGQTIELKQNEVKDILNDARRLPVLIAYKTTRQHELDQMHNHIIQANEQSANLQRMLDNKSRMKPEVVLALVENLEYANNYVSDRDFQVPKFSPPPKTEPQDSRYIQAGEAFIADSDRLLGELTLLHRRERQKWIKLDQQISNEMDQLL